MVKHYLVTAFRNLYRNRTYATINIIGLVLGVSISFLMLIHIRHELGYENAFPKADRTYRVSYTSWAKSALPLAGELEKFFPDIEETGRLSRFSEEDVMIYNDTHLPVRNGYFADQSVLSIFNVQFIVGNPETALMRPQTIVLSESIAKKLFKDENPLGKSVHFGGVPDLEITGVMKDLPDNTHLNFQYLVSFNGFLDQLSEGLKNNRNWMNPFTYVVLPEGHDLKEYQDRMHLFTYSFLQGIETKEELDTENDFLEFFPVTAIHLHSHREQEMTKNSEVTYVYIFSALAVLIIVMASVNFINLFITQLLKRSKEVGLRKVIGAHKRQVVSQFMVEGFMSLSLATAFSIVLCNALLPVYNQLAGITLPESELLRMQNLSLLFGVVAVIFVFAIGLPALFMSGFKPISALKGLKLPTSSLLKLRQRLVVFQFAISIFMITGTLVIYRQMDYVVNKDLGFDKESVLAIQLYDKLWVEAVEKRDVLRTELKRNPHVISIANASSFFGNNLSVERLIPEGADKNGDWPVTRCVHGDEGILTTLGLQLIDGRTFDPSIDNPNDSTTAFIINETAARMMKLKNPVGVMAQNNATSANGKIVGLIKDFNYASLHTAIQPYVIEYRPDWVGTMYIRMAAGDKAETVDYIEKTIKEIVPNTQILYSYLDDNIASMYSNENSMKDILMWFSFFTMTIAALGLFTLAAYITEIRTKEVGIRKVLGSSVRQIVMLFSRDYIKMIAVAFLLAVPVSYYFINKWLEGFAYQIHLAWWMFILPGLAVLFIAIIAASGQSLKAALANPTESLRSE